MAMKLVAGNWKMFGSQASAKALVESLIALQDRQPAACAVALCPPAVLLPLVTSRLPGSRLVAGGQDCSDETGPGAFTGEISASMLRDVGADYVILGHSERRKRHGEGDDLVRRKAERALAVGLIPIICVGETLEERQAGRAAAVAKGQLLASLPEAARQQLVVIAYEPVWAIGTGQTATPDDVAAMHHDLRNWLIEAGFGTSIPLLYGGSVKPDNAAALLRTEHVDGALVGGASLKAEDFWAIVQASPGQD